MGRNRKTIRTMNEAEDLSLDPRMIDALWRPPATLLGTVCIGCGCTDDSACAGGCSWIAVDPSSGKGLCSRCATTPLDELVARAELQP